MYQTYPEEIQKEEERLQELLFNLSDDVVDIDDFIKKNASDEYKAFMKKKNEYDAELLAQGIIEN